MKKLNQKGLAAVYIVLALVVVGAAGFFAYSRVKDSKPDNKAKPETTQTTKKDDKEVKPNRITELDDEIDLIHTEDVSKLPKSVPSSFVAYIKDVLQINDPAKHDEDDCLVVYSVSKISTVNILGSTHGVIAATHKPEAACGGGAKVVYYLKDGKWDRMIRQDIALCDELVEAKVYKEFLSTCLDDSNNQADNPNGSINDADI